jgi:hypothetical protein
MMLLAINYAFQSMFSQGCQQKIYRKLNHGAQGTWQNRIHINPPHLRYSGLTSFAPQSQYIASTKIMDPVSRRNSIHEMRDTEMEFVVKGKVLSSTGHEGPEGE